MSHQSVVRLIEHTAKSIGQNIQFGYGRRSDFNIIPDKSDHWIWLLPLTANPRYALNDVEMYQKQWNCIIIFLKHDPTDSTEVQYKPILDTLDKTVDTFIHRLNDWYLKQSDEVGAVTLSGFQQSPIFKQDAGSHTGWFVSFQMVTDDSFDYCLDENDIEVNAIDDGCS